MTFCVERHVNLLAMADTKFIEAAMQLPDGERAELAAILTDSLGDGCSRQEVEAAWIAEVRRRRDAVVNGGPTRPVAELFAHLRSKYTN